DAVPYARPGLAPAHPFRLPVKDPAPRGLVQVAPRHVERDAALLRVLGKIVLTFAEALGLPRLDRAVAERLGLIGDDEAVVDADHAAEAAAGRAGAERRIEREQRGRGLLILDVAVGTMQPRRKAPERFLR